MTMLVRKAWLLAVVGSILFGGCGESDNLVKKKLDLILKSDLDTITTGVQKSGLLDTPYYEIVSYKSYKEGIYTKLAVVDFYFMKNIKAKIVRKYRYLAEAGLWDRFFNQYQFYGDSALTKQP
jgi:hypothetical protein